MSRRTATLFAALLTIGLVAAPMTGLAPVPVARADLTASDWDTLRDAFDDGGTQTIVLSGDVVATSGESLGLGPGDDVTLDLAGHSLTIGVPSAGAGIGVPAGAALTVVDGVGGGELTASGAIQSAGIGGTYLVRGGAITIAGGTVVATGGFMGAGIGGGLSGDAGTILITGGTVRATGGTSGAGIGGGQTSTGSGSITITGGVVDAHGGNSGAAIGGGNRGHGVDTTVTGGVVTATGRQSAAGIGGGRWADGADITLAGGTISVTGGSRAAGIGAGFNDNPPHTQTARGTITIVGTAMPGGDVWDGGDGVGHSRPGRGGLVTVTAGAHHYRASSSVNDYLRTFAIDFGWLVSFDTNGGTPASIDPVFVLETEAVPEPVEPVNTPPLNFTGWRVGAASGALWDFTSAPTAQMTLVASWNTPVNTSLPLISGDTDLGSTLTATPGGWDDPGLEYSYQWYRDATSIAGADSAGYVLVTEDLGSTTTVEVTAVVAGDPYSFPGKATSAGLAIPLGTMVLPVPTITGTWAVGEAVSAAATSTPAADAYQYQWLRDAADIGSATGPDYTLVPADAGHEVSVRVTAVKGHYEDAVATSAEFLVAPGDFDLAVAPQMSGTAGVGHELSVTTGDWIPVPTRPPTCSLPPTS